MGTTDAQRHQMKLIKNLRIHHLQFPISIAANAPAAPGDFGAPAFATRAQQQQQQRLAKAVYLRHMSHQSAAAAAAAAAPPPAAGTFRSTCHIHSQSHVSQSSVGRGRVSSSKSSPSSCVTLSSGLGSWQGRNSLTDLRLLAEQPPPPLLLLLSDDILLGSVLGRAATP